jgi:hypothetical protein
MSFYTNHSNGLPIKEGDLVERIDKGVLSPIGFRTRVYSAHNRFSITHHTGLEDMYIADYWNFISRYEREKSRFGKFLEKHQL